MIEKHRALFRCPSILLKFAFFLSEDMATTAVAIGKIELQVRKEQPIPEGWALGRDCKITTDAREAFEAGLLLPLGGLEVTSGYKGLNCFKMPADDP